MTLKVAILGTVPTHRNLAPFDDPSWEIWVCSPGNSQQSAPARITKWFELHAMVDMKGKENESWYGAYIGWLNANADKFPIYMQERNTDVPKALPFPRRALLNRWGPSKTRTNWFTSSPSWMIAYALHLGATELGIYGIDMAAAEEHYTGQKAGLLRWFEIARENGCRVEMPLESTLAFPYPLYGYAEASRYGRSAIIREHELTIKSNQVQQQLQQLMIDQAFIRGSLEQLKFDRRTFVSGLDDAEINEEPFLEAVPQAIPTSTDATAAGSTEQVWTPIQPMQSDQLLRTEPPSAADFPNVPDASLLQTPVHGKRNGPWKGDV